MIRIIRKRILGKNNVLPRAFLAFPSSRPVISSSRSVLSGAPSEPLSSRGTSNMVGVAPSLATTDSHSLPRPHSEIPGPRSWPMLGSWPAMLTDPAFDAHRLPKLWESYFKKYGPIFKLSLIGQGDLIYISDPRDIEHLFKETFDNPVRPFFESLKKVREINTRNFFKEHGTGVFTEHGEKWWRVRKRAQVHSLKPRTVAHYLPQVDQVAQEFVARSAGQRDHKNELPGDFVQELFKWALESLCLVALNKRVGCLENSEEGLRIINSSTTMMDASGDCEYGVHLWKYFTTPALRRMLHSHDDLLEVVLEKVGQAKKDLDARDPKDSGELNILESLLTTPGLSLEDVVTFMVDFFFAGIDTTSMTSVFTLYYLARHPDKQARLQQELDQVLGDGSQALTTHQMGRLTYTKACVREALRMHPITSLVSRRHDKDITLQGYTVRAGSHINVSIKESGMREEYFPRATEYLPERWLRANPDRSDNVFASIPFSMGTRMCVGKRLAEQEVYVLLARLFSKYNLDYKYEEWDPLFRITYRPDKPQTFTMTERSCLP
ncbi:probable cytochrome P450 49a1 [Procambarus clarkii]|uniref:probable cytochrome P450 49a1 n=1 Tax=Procambarus clarkii TaxID=6728 RepID=UPI001E67116A|nr:probable cytochrome P450 49a1 [Procambarus clarkii]XP_045623412.1 probable cytochrome P450 49a1 [Procambarus clarkii]XP_045623413.1 probable cytochrome P450 49a1 [Procambarus clarkii]